MTSAPTPLQFSKQRVTIGCDEASRARPSQPARSIAARVLLFAGALGFLLLGINRPQIMTFDESCYVSAAKAFLAHAPTTNPEHPPAGKYFIAAGIRTFGDNPVGWRFASAVFGALTLLAVFCLCELLLENMAIALLATAFTALNGFWFVLARTAMLEIFLVAFSIWAVLAFTAAAKCELGSHQRRLLLCTSGVLFGIAAACKWNAVADLAVAQLIAAAALLHPRAARYRRNLLSAGLPWLICSLTLIPVAAYLLSYLPLYLAEGRAFTLSNLAAMHAWMWHFHASKSGNPAIAMPWYRWIFRTDPQRALSYLLGNFAVAWGGMVALAALLWKQARRATFAESTLVLLYLANVLIWAVTRPPFTYYYHYLPAIMFLGPILAIAVTRVRTICGVRPVMVVTIAAVLVFATFYPRILGLDARWTCVLGCHN